MTRMTHAGTLYGGNASVRFQDGRVIQFGRWIGWIVTTPVLLNMINQLGNVSYMRFNMNSFVLCLDVMMLLFGVSSSLVVQSSVQWFFIFCSFLCFCGIYRVSLEIFICKTKEFENDASEGAFMISNKIKLMATCFFGSWIIYPTLFIMGPEVCPQSHEETLRSLAISFPRLSRMKLGVTWF